MPLGRKTERNQKAVYTAAFGKEKIMEITKLPLETRLKRIKQGRDGHLEFITLSILSLRDMPIKSYFHSYEEAHEKLARILFLTNTEKDLMTYGEAAERIDILCKNAKTLGSGAAALDLLALPMKDYYRNRRCADADNNKPFT